MRESECFSEGLMRRFERQSNKKRDSANHVNFETLIPGAANRGVQRCPMFIPQSSITIAFALKGSEMTFVSMMPIRLMWIRADGRQRQTQQQITSQVHCDR
jgi:hypothetical protein